MEKHFIIVRDLEEQDEERAIRTFFFESNAKGNDTLLRRAMYEVTAQSLFELGRPLHIMGNGLCYFEPLSLDGTLVTREDALRTCKKITRFYDRTA